MYDEYFENLDKIQNRTAYRDRLFWDILLRRNEAISVALQQNFSRNCEWAKKYKMSFSDNFRPIELKSFNF